MSQKTDILKRTKPGPNGKKPKNVKQMGLKKLIKNFGPLKNVKIFTGNANPKLVRKVCNYLSLSIGEAQVGRFANGEPYAKIKESVRGQTCVVIQSICRSKLSSKVCTDDDLPKGTWNSPSDNFLELAFLIDALNRAWADDVIMGMPYYGFSKQERKKGRDSISAEIIARFLQTLNIRGGFAFSLHAPAIAGFFKCPFDDIPLLPLFIRLIRKNGLINEKTKVVAIDSGGVKKAHPVANRVELDLAVTHKHRDPNNPDRAKTIIFAGDVKNYLAIIVEDMIQKGTTLQGGIKALKEHGASGVVFICTHADLCGESTEYIMNEDFIKKVIITDTTPLANDLAHVEKVEIISVSEIIAEIIYRNIKRLPATKFFLWD